MALFVDRARAVRASFRLSAHNWQAVAALVRHLQGMPLAIELAASRVRSLSPAVLLGLLQDAAVAGPAGGGTLALLARSGARAGGDPRHASMLAVLQWSWQLLSPEARRLLPQLTAFAGGFSLAAAAALADEPCTKVARALDELVAQSMLRAAPDGDQRYALFELVREFAAGSLDTAAAAALRQRHRHWLTAWFGALPLATPLQRVRPEMANLAAALLGAAADGAHAEAAALAGAAQVAASALLLPPPVLAALQRCADRLADPLQRALLRANLSRALLLGGQTEAADRLATQAMAELPGAAVAMPSGCGDDADGAPGLARAQVLTRAAHVRWRLHRDAGAAAWLEQALTLAEAAQAPALQASILTNLAPFSVRPTRWRVWRYSAVRWRCGPPPAMRRASTSAAAIWRWRCWRGAPTPLRRWPWRRKPRSTAANKATCASKRWPATCAARPCRGWAAGPKPPPPTAIALLRPMPAPSPGRWSMVCGTCRAPGPICTSLRPPRG